MKKEIEKAVESFCKLAFSGEKQGETSVSEEKLKSFGSALTEKLTTRYKEHWYANNPHRGSGYRCIRINTQSIDPVVRESMKQAAIPLGCLQRDEELTVWADPGSVTVRVGEFGHLVTEIVDPEVYKLGLDKKHITEPVVKKKKKKAAKCSTAKTDVISDSEPNGHTNIVDADGSSSSSSSDATTTETSGNHGGPNIMSSKPSTNPPTVGSDSQYGRSRHHGMPNMSATWKNLQPLTGPVVKPATPLLPAIDPTIFTPVYDDLDVCNYYPWTGYPAGNAYTVDPVGTMTHQSLFEQSLDDLGESIIDFLLVEDDKQRPPCNYNTVTQSAVPDNTSRGFPVNEPTAVPAQPINNNLPAAMNKYSAQSSLDTVHHNRPKKSIAALFSTIVEETSTPITHSIPEVENRPFFKAITRPGKNKSSAQNKNHSNARSKTHLEHDSFSTMVDAKADRTTSYIIAATEKTISMPGVVTRAVFFEGYERIDPRELTPASSTSNAKANADSPTTPDEPSLSDESTEPTTNSSTSATMGSHLPGSDPLVPPGSSEITDSTSCVVAEPDATTTNPELVVDNRNMYAPATDLNTSSAAIDPDDDDEQASPPRFRGSI